LFLGAALVYLVASKTGKTEAPAAAVPVASSTEAPAAGPGQGAPKAVVSAPVRQQASASAAAPGAAGTQSAWARLEAKYGPQRTALSAKITTDLAEVIDTGMELASTGAQNSGSASVAEAASRGVLRRMTTQLGLSDEQRDKAAALIESAVTERVGAVTELAAAMRSEPEQMMELFLAGDALSRNEITQEEYDGITQQTRAMLQNLGGFVMGGGAAGGGTQILGNEELAKQLNAILTPEQQGKLAEITARATEQAQARQARGSNSGMPLQNGRIPVMDLDRMDQSIASVKKMEEAARLMMEAMKGLKDANPGAGVQ